MEIKNILSLIGGLALFLYGMHQMGNGLEVAAGDKMESILEKLTSNRFVGILLGAVVTCLIQSSSATTVMVVGFVNSGLMKLENAVWVIMGANIGTTVTGQLIALDVSAIAPIFAITGTIMITFVKNKKVNSLGEVIGGLGILFIGMGMMSDSMKPLRDIPEFVNLMSSFSNPILGILAGAIFTAAIQSSSASIGILQSMALAGVIGLDSAVYVLFGQNIGTCITSLLASLGANRNAKRATLVHFLFNIIGTLIFVCICLFTPFVNLMISITPNNVMAQIANTHTVFNIVTTALLIPFGKQLAQMTYNILPLAEAEKEESMELKLISEQRFGSAYVAIASLTHEVQQMFALSRKSLRLTKDVFIEGAKLDKEKIARHEEIINRIDLDINNFMGLATSLDMDASESAKVNALYKLSVDIERIGDHCVNLAEYAHMVNMKEIIFDESIRNELIEIYSYIDSMVEVLMDTDMFEDASKFQFIEETEQKVDDATAHFRKLQIERLQSKNIEPKAVVIYSEMLTDLERVSDYLMNIAEEFKTFHLTFIMND